jgi:hypothetical protein
LGNEGEDSPGKIHSVDNSVERPTSKQPKSSSLLIKSPSGVIIPAPPKEPYIPVTVLSIYNHDDFTRISHIIHGTYDATSDKHVNQAYKKEMTHIKDNSYDMQMKRLRANPFGIFGGSPQMRKNIHNFDLPYKKLSENKPLLDQLK